MFAFSFASTSLGVAFAQEKGSLEVLIEGYDGRTVMDAHLLDSSFEYIENKTISTASFSFTDVPLNRPYFVLVHYKGIPYTSQINFNQTSPPVKIRVFELAESDEGVIVGLHHVTITRSEDSLNVTEFIQFYNIGDRVLNGTEVKIAMPPGYKNFRSSHSCCVERTDFGFFFVLPDPLLPNETQTIDLRYEVSPDGDDYTFAKRAYYDTVIVIVTVATEDLRVASTENLQNEGPIDIDQKSFDAYSASEVFAGQGFAITLTGYRTSGMNILWVGTAVLVVLIIGAVVYGFRGSRLSIERLEAEEDALNSVITELEKDFEEGKIKELDYLKLKIKYKTRLEKVQNRIQQFSRVKRES